MSRPRKSFAACFAASRWSRRRASASGCARSSVSSHDIASSRAENGLDLEPIVEDNDVGGGTRLEDADVGAPDQARGNLSRRADRLLERDTEGVEIADGVDHRQDRA